MDIKVYEADLKRVDNCMDKLLELSKEESECIWEKKFIDYFKKKYVELPWMRYQLTLYFNHSKEAYSNHDEETGKKFYAEYCNIKENIKTLKNELEAIKEKNMYY